MKGPPYVPFGYGPWPSNDILDHDPNPSPHYRDGYDNRGPGGTHMEEPDDLWIDRIVYPPRGVRQGAMGDMMATARADMLRAADAMEHEQDARSRAFRISVGNVTGKKPGPSED